MRLAHPLAKLATIANARCIDLHPLLEVLSTHPARIQLAKRSQKRGCLRLQRRRRFLGVRCGNGVEEGPGRATQLRDVWRAVFWQRGWERGALLFAAEGEERAHVVTRSAAVGQILVICSPTWDQCALRVLNNAWGIVQTLCKRDTHGLPSAS